MSYLEELLPEFRKGAKIRRTGVPQPANAKGYIFYKEGKIYNKFGRECDHDLGFWLSKNDWEIYQEPINWDYIIKNKCLCYFWDIVEEFKIVGILCKINDDGEHKFVRNFEDAKIAYRHCRPVRRDEVTFYEDKKDE